MKLSDIVSISMIDRFDIPVKTAVDGLLLRVISPDTRTIRIHVETANLDVRCFTVDTTKCIHVLSDKSEDPAKRHFSRGVRIITNKDGKPCAKYPDNNVRVMAFTPEGKVRLWTVSIVNQDQKFFLTTQENGEFQFYRAFEDGKTVAACPDIERWDSLVQFVNDLLDPDELPPISEYKPAPKKDGKAELADNEGCALWFSDAENYGVIQTADGPARVHWSAIERPNSRRAFLKTGEKVAFAKLVSPNLTRARSTAFRFEAVGVKVVEAKP